MTRKVSRHRVVRPTLLVFAAALVSFLGYFVPRHWGDGALFHPALAGLFGTGAFLSVAFGPLYIGTIATVRGAALVERIPAAFVTPFLWMTKEVVLLTESHPLAECFYWYLNPLNLWLSLFVLVQLGVGTLIARSILKRRGAEVKVVTAAPVLVIVGSLSLVIALFAWGKGENVYVLFLEGYRHLFGSGV